MVAKFGGSHGPGTHVGIGSISNAGDWRCRVCSYLNRWFRQRAVSVNQLALTGEQTTSAKHSVFQPALTGRWTTNGQMQQQRPNRKRRRSGQREARRVRRISPQQQKGREPSPTPSSTPTLAPRLRSLTPAALRSYNAVLSLLIAAWRLQKAFSRRMSRLSVLGRWRSYAPHQHAKLHI